MHFLTYFTRQGTLIMLNALCKVEDHENHVRWIYLTTVLNMGTVRSLGDFIRIIGFCLSLNYTINGYVTHTYQEDKQ